MISRLRWLSTPGLDRAIKAACAQPEHDRFALEYAFAKVEPQFLNPRSLLSATQAVVGVAAGVVVRSEVAAYSVWVQAIVVAGSFYLVYCAIPLIWVAWYWPRALLHQRDAARRDLKAYIRARRQMKARDDLQTIFGHFEARYYYLAARHREDQSWPCPPSEAQEIRDMRDKVAAAHMSPVDRRRANEFTAIDVPDTTAPSLLSSAVSELMTFISRWVQEESYWYRDSAPPKETK